MQDIDFDEIDRAVSSITSTNTEAGATDTPSVAPASTTVDSPAVRRSSGRFMDVVHPSSDMRPPVPPRPAAPFAPTLHREEVPGRSEAVESRPEPVAVSSSAFHWPDPIEAMTPVAEPTPVATDATPSVEPAPAPFSTPDLAPVSTNEETDTSLESPFLSDAKVEKRPLGAFSGADADLPLIEDPMPAFGGQTAPSPADAPAETSEVPAIPDIPVASEVDLDVPATPATDLHELHEDVLSLDGHVQEAPQSDLSPSPAPTPEVPTTQVPTAPVATDIPTGPTSITQQYKEQPQVASEPAGSIFDTEAYHQPLTHTAKKHSGALIAVWIVALILIGAGVGAGIYFVVLPLLG